MEAQEEATKKAAEQSVQSLESGDAAQGDVTELLGANNMDASAKIKMCDNLNKQGQKKREAEINHMMLKAALHILRLRLRCFKTPEDAKTWMESHKDGYRSRLAFVDITQLQNLQVKGEQAKFLCRQPNKDEQIKLGQAVKLLPVTPVTGAVLCRSGGRNIVVQDFWTELNTFKYPRSMHVPIDLPPVWQRIMKSAARRSLGPSVDMRERSGVELELRTIGGMASTSDQGAVDSSQELPPSDEEPEEATEHQNPEDIDPMELDGMSERKLKQKFGTHSFQVLGSLFQHSSKIAEPGRFLDRKDFMEITNEYGKKMLYRRGQLHETVLLSAIKSSLAVSAVPLNRQDVFVQACGGTPEACVAAILAGFQNVLYIGTAQEITRIQLPTEAEENTIDWDNYVSPNPTVPDQGLLGIFAVQKLKQYVRNCVFENMGEIMLPPPFPIALPPLTKYSYMGCTGRVHCRTVHVGESISEVKEERAPSTAAASSASPSEPGAQTPGANKKRRQGTAASGPGSASGRKPPPEPVGMEDDDDGEGDDTENSEDDPDDAEGQGDDLSILDKLEAEEAGGKSKGGRPKKAAKKNATPKKAE